MALSQEVIFEVRTTGNDNNGGGFTQGASGTDYSHASIQTHSSTALVIGSAGSEDDLSSAADNFASDDIGNLIHVTAGSGFTTGFYEVLSVAAGVATVDRNVGTADSTSGTGVLGGALLTIQAAHDGVTDGRQRIYVRGGTYSISTAITLSNSGAAFWRQRLIGYSTSRGDFGRPIISVTAAVNALTISGQGWRVENFELDGTSTGARGIELTALYCWIESCHVHHFINEGVDYNSSATNNILRDCEVNNCVTTSGSAAIQVDGTPHLVIDCYVHDNSATGIRLLATSTVVRCISESNTGGSSHGFYSDGFGGQFIDCVAYSNGGDGLRMDANYPYIHSVVQNCILDSNSGYGLNLVGLGGTNVDSD